MHLALHPRDEVDRIYVSRKKRGRGLTGIKDSVDASWRLHRVSKARRKIDLSQQRHYWQQEDKQIGNNPKKQMRRKTTQWTF